MKSNSNLAEDKRDTTKPASLESNNERSAINDDQVKFNKGEKSSTKEINGPKGLEPTRYGDWESQGRCYDF